MRQRTWFVIGCLALALGLAAAGKTRSGAGRDEPAAADSGAKARLEIARGIYEQMLMRQPDPFSGNHGNLMGAPRPPQPDRKVEDLYLWSRRWMEAERDVRPDGGGIVVAFRGHRDRMKDLGTIESLKGLYKKRNIPYTDELLAGQAKFSIGVSTEGLPFFRLEAESWLAKATASQPR